MHTGDIPVENLAKATFQRHILRTEDFTRAAEKRDVHYLSELV